jgi:hypothetical protein
MATITFRVGNVGRDSGALLLTTAFLLVMSGCRSSDSESAPTTAAATTTVATSGVQIPVPGEAWDLLYISDSGGWGVADLLADEASEALGVEVRVHDESEGGRLSAATVLERLRDETTPSYTDLVGGAEIIVVYGNPEGSGYTSDMQTCVSPSTAEREPPSAYSPEDWQPYREVLNEIYDEIWAIRAGAPTVLRATDLYNPLISAWSAAGVEPECTAAWESLSNVIDEAAVANGATMVSAYDVINGPEHDEDPRETGYIGPDGEHTTDEGAGAIADALAAVGFEPSTKP